MSADNIDGLILGFDPGGKGDDRSGGNFGWSICDADGDFPLCPLYTGLAHDALEAITRVRQAIEALKTHGRKNVLAAGIDTPMFWGKRGDRVVDDILRRTVIEAILPRPAGNASVISVNSLQGADLVQGALLGKYLREQWDGVEITESHPKVFRRLLLVTSQPEIAVRLAAVYEHLMERGATIHGLGCHVCR